MGTFRSSPKVRVKQLTNGPKHHFFGYFDHSPWSYDGSKIIATETDFQGRPPSESDTARIVLLDSDGDRIRDLGGTRAWNFQQGALANWFPGGGVDSIWFNDRKGQKPFGCVLKIESGERTEFNHAFGDVDPTGQFAVAMNFGRIRYSYAGVVDEFALDSLPDNDGIRVISLVSGESQLICGLKEIAALGRVDSSSNSKHWVEHVLFSPSGRRIAFFHRFVSASGMTTRLMAIDIDGSNLSLIRSGMVSHATWRTDTEILAWAREDSTVAAVSRGRLQNSKIVSPLIHLIRTVGGSWYRQRLVGDKLTLFDIDSGRAETIGFGIIQSDGHFSYSPDLNWILGDTYPDRNQMQALFIFNVNSGQRVELGQFKSDVGNGVDRCDLHPRWNRDGSMVIFDSVHSGSRQMYTVDVSDLVHK